MARQALEGVRVLGYQYYTLYHCNPYGNHVDLLMNIAENQ